MIFYFTGVVDAAESYLKGRLAERQEYREISKTLHSNKKYRRLARAGWAAALVMVPGSSI